jgi:hypothetical protein
VWIYSYGVSLNVVYVEYIFRCVLKIAKSVYWLRHVRPSAQNSAPTARIFMKFDILAFSENLSRKFKFH